MNLDLPLAPTALGVFLFCYTLGMKQYDLIVIGSGGGTKISTPAAKMGKRVAIIEKESLGGTCLNRGCIPSKMFIHPANQLLQAKDLGKYSISHSGTFEVDFGNLVSRISNTVDTDSANIEETYKTIDNLDYFHGEARFIGKKIIEVNGEQLTADTIILAVGSRPLIPPIEGLAGTPYMTSREALRPEKLPKKIIVIGGGYIATELGHVYSAMGSQTTFFVRDIYLSREDKTIQNEFQNVFEKNHKTHYGLETLSVSYEKEMFTVTGTGKNGETIVETADALFVATGVVPNTDQLNLEHAGIALSKRGYIEINEHLETSAAGIYAIGDCVGNYLFRHSVNFEGEYLFGQLFGEGIKTPIIYPPMPHAVFSHPEIAGIGKTEQELEHDGANYLAVTHEYKDSAQGMARLPEVGMVKLLFDRETKKLLGAHIIGDEAATMLHQLVLGMSMEATCDDLLRMIYIHPALPEVIRNAARKAKQLLSHDQHHEKNIS